jgi:hypothetical protein
VSFHPADGLLAARQDRSVGPLEEPLDVGAREELHDVVGVVRQLPAKLGEIRQPPGRGEPFEEVAEPLQPACERVGFTGQFLPCLADLPQRIADVLDVPDQTHSPQPLRR